MNRPASKEPSMDEILSSIRQIIADDDPVPPSNDAASAGQSTEDELANALNDVDMEGEATTIEVKDGPHPDIEAPPIERRDVAAEALAEAASASIEPDLDEDAPLALSVEQMLKPGQAKAHDPDDDELIADPGDVSPQEEELDMAALLLQEGAGISDEPDDSDAKDIEMSVPDDVSQVVPDDIAFINDDDSEDDDGDNALAGMGIDDLPEDHDPAPEPESPLPDKSLSSDLADGLLEPTARAATSHAFSQLDNLILSQNQGQTIEDLIREMLKPMLKSWLDENLPGVVEQLVQREIERVSRGKR